MSYTRPSIVRRGSVPRIPKGPYTVMVNKAEIAVSKSSGNPQVILDLEIMSPETVDFNGTIVKVAGQKTKMYISFSEKNLGNVLTFLDGMHVPLPEAAAYQEEDIKNLQLATVTLVNSLFQVVLSSNSEPMTDFKGNPVLDSNGQPIMGQEQIDCNMFNVLANTRIDVNGNPL
jgi:hypothetical protein